MDRNHLESHDETEVLEALRWILCSVNAPNRLDLAVLYVFRDR